VALPEVLSREPLGATYPRSGHLAAPASHGYGCQRFPVEPAAAAKPGSGGCG
jgi:hypothetical protein